MKNNKFSLFGVLIVVLISCSSCGFFGEQRYFCDVDNVKSVEIIRLDDYIEEEYRYEYTVLCEIKDYYVFIDRLNNLSHRVWWGEPNTFEEGYVYIKIEYINGDYDEIHYMAQSKRRNGVVDAGFFIFDKEQFDELISDYLK